MAPDGGEVCPELHGRARSDINTAGIGGVGGKHQPTGFDIGLDCEEVLVINQRRGARATLHEAAR